MNETFFVRRRLVGMRLVVLHLLNGHIRFIQNCAFENLFLKPSFFVQFVLLHPILLLRMLFWWMYTKQSIGLLTKQSIVKKRLIYMGKSYKCVCKWSFFSNLPKMSWPFFYWGLQFMFTSFFFERWTIFLQLPL